MSEFNDFIDASATEATATAGEPITIGAQTANAVFEEQSMAVGIERFGDTEEITDSCVIAKADLTTIPAQKQRITRVNTGVRYYVTSVNEDGGHVELMLYREGAKRGNG